VVEELIKEQFTEVLPEEVKAWVKARTSEEAGQLAEDYRQARKKDLWVPNVEPKKGIQKVCCICKQPGHLARNCQKKGLPAPPGNGENTSMGYNKGEKKK